jgi:hypothetical protein
MLRIRVCFVAGLLAAAMLSTASAQTTAPAPSKIKMTIEHLKELRAKWVLNKPKLRACRAEVKSKGLTGDDRWFYMEDCMTKT